jgi:O-antigen ligase
MTTATCIVIFGQSQRFDLSPDRLLASQGVVERQTVWYAAYKIFSTNPFLGSGFSSFKKESKPYVEKHRKNIHEKYKYENLEDAHNIIMHIAAETGIIGLIANIFLFGVTCKHTWKLKKNNKSAQCLFLCILITLIHLQLHAHLASTNISSLVFLLFGLSMGTNKFHEQN